MEKIIFCTFCRFSCHVMHKDSKGTRKHVNEPKKRFGNLRKPLSIKIKLN